MVGGGVPGEFSVLLWSKVLILDLDQAEQNVVSRGSTSHVSSELIFMFLESVEHVEWGQLAS